MVKKGKSGCARKKREECKVRGKRRACFPRRNPRVSDLDSRLTKLAKYSKLSHPLVFSPLLRSIPRLESTSHLRRLCLPVSFFFLLSHPSCAYVLKESVLSPEYLDSLDYRQLPSCLYDRLATCIAIYISASLVNMLIIYLFLCFFVK